MREKRKAVRQVGVQKRGQNLVKLGRWPLFLLPVGQNWLCQRCSRRAAEKDGGDGKDAAGTSDGRRRIHKGGSGQKEKTGRK